MGVAHLPSLLVRVHVAEGVVHAGRDALMGPAHFLSDDLIAGNIPVLRILGNFALILDSWMRMTWRCAEANQLEPSTPEILVSIQ